jgi:hypothetical protein
MFIRRLKGQAAGSFTLTDQWRAMLAALLGKQ